MIVAHFDKHPLISKKRAEYELFKLAVGYIQQGLHLRMEGLIKIINIKASFNKGLPDELKAAFSSSGIVPVARPLVQNQPIPDPYWIAGFMSGVGCLMVRLKKSSTHRTAIQV